MRQTDELSDFREFNDQNINNKDENGNGVIQKLFKNAPCNISDYLVLFLQYGYQITCKDRETIRDKCEYEVYKKYVDEYYRTLAMGIYNLQYAYDPSMIIIGGAISSRSDLLDKVNEQLDIIFSQLTHAHVRPNIKVCQFGNDANLIGATYHYIQRH